MFTYQRSNTTLHTAEPSIRLQPERDLRGIALPNLISCEM